MYNQRIHSVNFAAHTAEEVRSLAVKRITNAETYDQLLHPNYYGLYDPALGACEKDDICDTCGMNSLKCPGHMGYIELPLPIYHPMFFKLMLQVLRGSCFTCHRLICKISRKNLFIRQCELLDKGLLTEANNLRELFHAFTVQATEESATDMNVQKVVCKKIDTYYNDAVSRIKVPQVKTACTKNIIRCKQDLIKEFIKVHLTSKTKECPHCKSLRRDVRSEYNTRIYFKAASQKAVKKAVSEKMAKSTKAGGKDAFQSNVKQEANAEENSEMNETANYEDDDVLDYEEEEVQPENEDETETEDTLKKKLLDQEYITPTEVKAHMIQLWLSEYKLLKYLLGSFSGPERKKRVTTPEIFFLDVVAVPPSRYRPQAFMGEKRFENPQTSNLCKVLWHCKLIEELLSRMKENVEDDDDVYVPVVLTTTAGFQKRGGGMITVPGKSYQDQLQNAWLELQTDVNTFMDCTLNKLVKDAVPGVRQLLEKKEGLFRKHMMGKRVNFACRSVISPDPYINTDEIGVPLVFASKLTYVQPVTTWNLAHLTQMVINGPKKHPGATMIEYEDGRKKILTDNEDERRAIAKQLLTSSVASDSARDNDRVAQGKKVHRHLMNGDVMLLNRQPTLHRPSIMAHKVKVLPHERTLRLHYANCKSYNADFDGDEMNAHFPQSELGRAEAYHLVSTNYNYLSPKDGKPLAGLIQDHVVSGVNMTSRGRFFDRSDYQQLIYSAFLDTPGRIKLLKPCILKPTPLWSGKQVISTVILNIIPEGTHLLNMNGNKAKISDQSWPRGKSKRTNFHVNDSYLTEGQVIVRGGHLMTGILDKTQYGATSFGLVHSIYELYGGKISGLLLSVFGRLFTTFLQHTGFTLGVEDILVLPDAEEKRCEIMEESRLCGDDSAIEALNMTKDEKENLQERMQGAHHLNNGFELKLLDVAMKSRTDGINNKINSACMRGLLKKFPDNALQLMVQSGAKGSSVNCMQISCLLGQIELEGRRPPLMTSGRSLPSFLPYDTSPRAGGFIDGRFLTGIRPQEYFYHCMAGREGLVDTAVKTSSSGYLQRCLIKHMEALYVQYDMTVRDGDGSVVQFLYGEDGIDVLKNQYLNDKQFKSILQNYDNYVKTLQPSKVSQVVDVKKAPKLQRKCDRWKRSHGLPYSSQYYHNHASPFLMYEKDHRKKINKKYSTTDKKMGFSEADKKLMERWSKSEGPTKDSYIKKCSPCPDPSLSLFNPTSTFGAVSERFHDEVTMYMASNADGMLVDEDKDEDEEISRGKIPNTNFHPLMLIKYMRSLVEPGEAVGLLASQSIGEPSTQMTLNTFHFAGRGDMNVTLGIPRLREILMTASERIKTPQMDVLVQRGKENEAKMIAKRMNKLNVMQVLKHISVHESLKRSCYDNVTRCREFRIKLEFLPFYSYEEDYDITPEQIMNYIETVFLKKIPGAVAKIIKTKEKQRLLQTKSNKSKSKDSSESEASEEAAAAPDEPDDLADLSDNDDGNDGDAANLKERNRQTQFTSYDNPEGNNDEENEMDIGQEDINESNIYTEEAVDLNDSENVDIKPNVENISQEDLRVQNVLRRDKHIVAYLVDAENEWCEVTLQFPLAGSKVMLVTVIEKLAEKSTIHESPGITRGMASESKDPNEIGRFRLKTEGLNIWELWKHPNILDLSSVYSNNIHTIAKTYGIEAARRALIKEVEDVFKVYGIHIDPRHLSLIGDYMTFEGIYKPFNRIGIESNPFPFQKMSFETSTHFLRQATAFGQPDDLGSPSSRIIVGRVIGTGTGMCDLLPKLTI